MNYFFNVSCLFSLAIEKSEIFERIERIMNENINCLILEEGKAFLAFLGFAGGKSIDEKTIAE